MRRVLVYLAYPLAVLVVAIAWFSFGFDAYTKAEAAQPAEPSECTAAATADGETLYSCNVDGVMCVWDPSPALGAGVLTCGW